MRQVIVNILFATLGLLLAFSFLLTGCAVKVSEAMHNAVNCPIGRTLEMHATMGKAVPATQFYDEAISKYLGIEFVIRNASSQGAEINLENKYGYDIGLGLDYTIVFINDDDVLKLPEYRSEFYVPLLIANPLSVLYLKDQYLDFEYQYGGLEPGQYRFEAEIVFLSPDLDIPWPAKNSGSAYKKVTLYTDFVVN